MRSRWAKSAAVRGIAREGSPKARAVRRGAASIAVPGKPVVTPARREDHRSMQTPAAAAATPPALPALAGRLSDERLVAAVREGDDPAFECLYDRYGRRVAGFVAGMVHDHGRAEDVTQEVFVSALRRLRATDAPIAFKPWIFEIARNACIDAHRRGRRAELVSLDGGGEDGEVTRGGRLAGPGPTPDAAAEGKLRLESLTGAFGGLSDVHHEILVMR